MELVQELLEKQEERIEEERKHTMNSFGIFNGAEIVASFNGVVIGELQSITYDVEYDRSDVTSIGLTGGGLSYEGSVQIGEPAVLDVFGADFSAIEEGVTAAFSMEMDRRLTQMLDSAFLDEMPLYQNRKERRKKKKQSLHYTPDNQGLRQMMGGRKHWN